MSRQTLVGLRNHRGGLAIEPLLDARLGVARCDPIRLPLALGNLPPRDLAHKTTRIQAMHLIVRARLADGWQAANTLLIDQHSFSTVQDRHSASVDGYRTVVADGLRGRFHGKHGLHLCPLGVRYELE